VHIKSLSYLYDVVRTNFSADFFWIFAISDRNFAKIVAPPSDVYAKLVVRLKEKNAENRVEIMQ